MRASTATLLAIGTLLAACQPQKNTSPETEADTRAVIPADINPDDAAEWTLACDNGQTLTMTFDHERQMVTVRRSDGLAFDLIRKTVSSGYLYSATPVEFRGDGKNARWVAPPVSGTDCHVTLIKPRNEG